MEEQAKMELKAANGILYVYDDRVMIVKKGLFALTLPDSQKKIEFFYNSLVGVDYKKPNIIDGKGHIRFLQADTVPFDFHTAYTAEQMNIQLQDPNTVVMSSANRKVANKSEEIYNFVLNKIEELGSSRNENAYFNSIVPVSNSGSVSGADEIAKYKELLDCGAITQEEFETAKKQVFAQNQQHWGLPIQNSIPAQNVSTVNTVIPVQQDKPLTKRERIKENKKNAVACCPKCGSTSLSANKKGFGIGKAVIGAGLIGNPIGLVAGNLNAKKIRVTCLNCGHQFWAGKK